MAVVTTREREYLLLKLDRFKEISVIDFLGEFSSIDTVLAYVENITYYKDQKEIDEITNTYNARKNNSSLAEAIKNEEIGFSGVQWDVDRTCWASVIRETLIDNRFSCITEKTIRTFIHHCVPIPLGYRSVEDLENLGFWFPHDMVDYSYQSEYLFSQRINKVISTLEQLSTYSFDQLQTYYVDNIDKFHYNAKLVHQISNSQPKLKYLL